MKLKKLFTVIALITVIVFLIAGCDDGTNGGGNGDPKQPDSNPTVTSVTVNPSAATVTKGQTQQFNAVVTGTNNPAQTVNWTVSGGVNGTNISPGGLLTVAANETASALTVRAVSTVDINKSGTATVTVTAPVPPVSWAVNNSASWIEAVNGIRNGGNNKNHIVTVSGDISVLTTPASDNTFGGVTGITVSIEGSGTVSISSDGRLLQIGSGQTVIVKNLTLQGYNGNSYGMVRINDGGIFRMEGSASVTGNAATVSGSGVYVNGGTFIMRDNASVRGNTVDNSYSDSYGGGVYVYGGTFDMRDSATVSDNTNTTGKVNGYAYGGGVYVGGGTFTLKDSATVKDNTVIINSSINYAYGGGVCIDGGTFIMEGGSISGNTASGGNYGNACGGGVYIDKSSNSSSVNFTMRGGAISDNTVNGRRVARGGGVYVENFAGIEIGTFTMENGVISGNTVSASGTIVSAGGGGVYGNILMKGGTISGNTVSANGSDIDASGGGVDGRFTMEGGVISGNTVSAVSTGSANVTVNGGGANVFNTLFTKTGGTIYGNDAAENLRNTAVGGHGHAVYDYYNDNWRNATAGPSMNSNSYGFWLNEEN
jgi:hypothetical protein